MHTTTRVVPLVTAMCGATWLGCAEPTPEVAREEPAGLVLTATGTDVTGRYVGPTHTIEFAMREVGELQVAMELTLGEDTIELFVDLGVGEAAYDIPPLVLDESARGALEQLATSLADALEGPDATTAEDQLVRATGFLALAPVGVKLGSFDFTAAKGWTHISCGCYYKYIGNGYYRTAGKGGGCTGGSGNGCKGRCGVGCGSSGHGAYTRDCAQHDYGLTSWWRASDDFTFAGWNC